MLKNELDTASNHALLARSPHHSLTPQPVLDQSHPNWAEQLNIWPAVAELLQAEHYGQVAELLLNMQANGSLVEDRTPLEILKIAQQICRAYGQCQAELKEHQQAIEAAAEQQRELSQQLHSLFGLTQGQVWTDQVALESGTIEPSPKTSFRVFCLGSFQVYYQGKLISDWSSFKARAIFKYLLMHRGAPVASDILMELFWPEADPDAARHNLHQAIHSLRKTLKQQPGDGQPVLCEANGYLLNPELHIWIDVVEFEQGVQLGQQLNARGQIDEAMATQRRAIELYQGDFLEEDLYIDWPIWPREHLRGLYLEIVNALSDYYLNQGEFAETVGMCQKLLACDNCHEEAYRRLMRCYLAQGQRRLAIRQYQLCVQMLRRELDVPPSAETQALYAQITAA